MFIAVFHEGLIAHLDSVMFDISFLIPFDVLLFGVRLFEYHIL